MKNKPSQAAIVLREARKYLGKSQKDAAWLHGVTERSYAEYESGKTPISPHNECVFMLRLSDMLKYRAEELRTEVINGYIARLGDVSKVAAGKLEKQE